MREVGATVASQVRPKAQANKIAENSFLGSKNK